MAVQSIPAPSAGVTPTPAHLSAARDALVARIDAAAARAQRLGLDMPGLPSGLASASCYLAACGVTAPACAGEAFFAWDLATSSSYLDGLDDEARADEIALGERALFTGKRAICPGLLDAARELTEAGDAFAKLCRDTQREANAWEAKRAAAERAYWARQDPMQVAA